MRFLIWTTVLLLLLAGCGASPTPGGDPTVSPLATPVGIQETSPLPTETATALPAPTATPPALSLLVLHTNDNWGETEPCG